MDILKTGFMEGFIRLCDDGAKFGWHERNGGNLSYRMKPEEVREVKEALNYDRPWLDIGTDVPGLADEYFLVTGTGRYFKNVALNPAANIGIIEVDEDGEKYRICWGLEESGPTSELPSHLMNHEVKKHVTNGTHRVIYHCHGANTIALTFILPLTDEAFTRELWEMMTECPVVFPGGIGVVDWMVPGGRAIAVKTSELMKKYDAAIWAHHGLFTSGEDFDSVFGLAHAIEKAAEIAVKVISMGGKKQTITPQNFKELAKDFNVELAFDFNAQS